MELWISLLFYVVLPTSVIYRSLISTFQVQNYKNEYIICHHSGRKCARFVGIYLEHTNKYVCMCVCVWEGERAKLMLTSKLLLKFEVCLYVTFNCGALCFVTLQWKSTGEVADTHWVFKKKKRKTLAPFNSSLRFASKHAHTLKPYV